MPYNKHTKISGKTPKANLVSLFLIFLISGLAILALIVSVVSAHFRAKPLIPATIVFHIPAVQTDDQKSAPILKTTIQAISEAHLKIPTIGVNAAIKELGITSDGSMAVPNNNIDVSWYDLGTRPGQTGSAVIGGHSRWGSGAGVFANLNKLQKGDVLSIIDAKGISISFMVRDMRTFEATDANSGVFQSDSGIHLNLITCSGTWNSATQSYPTRLVIYTDLVPSANKIAYSNTAP